MRAYGLVLLTVGLILSGCSPMDPAEQFIRQMDQSPPEKRPPDWERTKALMARRTPAVGVPAPDFTLKTVDGSSAVTRSELQRGRPLVLIFGSFT